MSPEEHADTTNDARLLIRAQLVIDAISGRIENSP